MMRIGFAGASGTGKTTLSNFIVQKYGIEYNPVGSRSVALEMGFKNPYEVDAAGRRKEFQEYLLERKMAWEIRHHKFVSDRTTFDNAAYSMLHHIDSINGLYLDNAIRGISRYTHIFYCPFHIFFDLDSDPMRKESRTYHELYDAALFGLLKRYVPNFYELRTSSLAKRQEFIMRTLATKH